MTKNTEIEKKLKRVQWIRTVINHHLDDVEDILLWALKEPNVKDTTTPLSKPMRCEVDDRDLFGEDLGMP